MPIIPFLEAAELIEEAGGKELSLCYQCGTCATTCPWHLFLDEYAPRRIIRTAQFGLEGYEQDLVWRCTSCKACVDICPRGINVINLIRALRRPLVESGAIPKNLRPILSSLKLNGNPWSASREERAVWTQKTDVKPFEKGTEYLLFTCCLSDIDARYRKFNYAAINILKSLGIDFGILPSEISCCGDAARKLGDEEGFQKVTKSNISLFEEKGVKKVIVTSPHCYNALKSEYPEFGGKVEVYHFVQIIADRLKDLNFKNKIEKKVTFHDPCYLGRHNDIYEQPRAILNAIPGMQFAEMYHNKADSLCCGGGGGGIWMEIKKEERFGNLRINEAKEIEANLIVTACPYCVNMLQDALLATGDSESIEIKEISEVIAEAIL